MSGFVCERCRCTSVTTRNARLECAHCGRPVLGDPRNTIEYQRSLVNGRLLLRARKYSQASDIFERLTQLAPGDTEAYIGLATALTRDFTTDTESTYAVSALNSARSLGASLPNAAELWLRSLVNRAEAELEKSQFRTRLSLALALGAFGIFWIFLFFAKIIISILAFIITLALLSKVHSLFFTSRTLRHDLESLRERLYR